ncbi:hypothetical protein ACN27G_27680 [Plantactinospora sp. WMMB334]|uniref:hypothetical protein n=1 Tax=Plantactinospora sp. WMMB334 TaxID=3404119 RepID=UPI003B9648F8
MTREEMRAYVRDNPINWPPLSQAQRLRLAVLLRPDLPIGIIRTEPEPVTVPPEAT